MRVKEEIIKIFENSRGEYFSGEELASRLHVSRSAVWKAVRQLEADGYQFDAASGRGYCLSPDSDVLSKQGIEKALGESVSAFDVKVYRTITSTNTVLKEMAANGVGEGTVLVASEQTAGRGRMNRRFVSPSGTGLYLSILLRPKRHAGEALFITTAAAVAVAQTVEEVSGRHAGVKWVNDVFLNGKKICGILTEASLDMESGGLEYAVCGIGVNVFPPDGGFPDEIKDIAGAVFDVRPSGDIRNRMAAGILKRFMAYYRSLPEHPFFEEYKRRSVTVGERVTVLGRGEPRSAVALAIDGECRLVVRYDDGSEEALNSGEISVRK